MQPHHTPVRFGWFAATLFLVVSCEKAVTTSSSSSTSAVFSATFAGVAWKADTVWASLVDDSVDVQKAFTISGYGNKRLVTIVITDSSKSGADSALGIRSYAALDDWLNSAAFTFTTASGSDTVWSAFGAGYSGQATVTADNASSKTISGSFQFSASVLMMDSAAISVDTVNVTNGVFSHIPYLFRYLR